MTTERTIKPFGSWPSIISSAAIASKTLRLRSVAITPTAIYWREMRPVEKGRNVVVRRGQDASWQETPAAFNVRTRVHEYGGGAFQVVDDTVYFSNFQDQQLYRHVMGQDPTPLTATPNLRFADVVVDTTRHRLISVAEDHAHASREPQTSLVAVDLDKGHVTTLVEGHDFFSSPQVSPAGDQLAWITWDHPNMPWDNTHLWVADLNAAGQVVNARCLSEGQPGSFQQPRWSPQGHLFVVHDLSNWWNIYRVDAEGMTAMTSRAAEYAHAPWMLGQQTYGFDGEGRLLATYAAHGHAHLERIDTLTGHTEALPVADDWVEVYTLAVHGKHLVAHVRCRTTLDQIVRVSLDTLSTEVLRRAAEDPVDPAWISHPQAITFPTLGDAEAYGFFYPPHSPAYQGPLDARPPLVIRAHGGPTSRAKASLDLEIQFWTSRGFAFFDINYGGSAGFGRAYRERLHGHWGIVDVQDCVHAAHFLADQGWVDRARIALRGGSAGGYTTLAAMATTEGTFAVGASLYGISDLTLLAKETHKFESRYLDTLIAPLPEGETLYRERSPMHAIERFKTPVIFLQGSEDPVVPANQSALFVDALRERGLRVAFILFDGEYHGFAQAANIKRAIEAELYFYATEFGIELVDEIEPV